MLYWHCDGGCRKECREEPATGRSGVMNRPPIKSTCANWYSVQGQQVLFCFYYPVFLRGLPAGQPHILGGSLSTYKNKNSALLPFALTSVSTPSMKQKQRNCFWKTSWRIVSTLQSSKRAAPVVSVKSMARASVMFIKPLPLLLAPMHRSRRTLDRTPQLVPLWKCHFATVQNRRLSLQRHV